MRLITTECCSYAHPDKMADQISDALLDQYLTLDSKAKVAIEVLLKDNIVVLGGEVNSDASIDTEAVVHDIYKTFGYGTTNISIVNLIGKQSSEINQAVVRDDGEIGAGDQGIMCGFASADTDVYMPLGVVLSRNFVNMVLELGYGPDLKTQVTIQEHNGKKTINTLLISTMHKCSLEELRETLEVEVLKNSYINDKTKILINPAGEWRIGGPTSDCGLTGRKIVIDQYGPYCTVGGGSLSSKDGTKVDRSGAYLCRYIAKNIVAAGLCYSCRVEIAYAIGVVKPVSLNITMFDIFNKDITNFQVDVTEYVSKTFPMTPKEIINRFGLDEPIFYQSARYGHFGIEDKYHAWEELDRVNDLKKLLH